MATDKFIDDTTEEAISGAADLLDQAMRVGSLASLGDIAVVQAAATIAVARVLRDIRDIMKAKK